MSFTEFEREVARNKLSILEKTIKQRILLEKRWEAQDTVYFEDGTKVQLKTDVNFKSVDGFTQLDLAIMAGDVEKAKGLVAKGAQSDKAFLLSLGLGSKAFTKLLFDKEIPFDYFDLNCSLAQDPTFSIREDMLKYIRELCQSKITDGLNISVPNLDAQNRNPLHHYAFLDFETFKESIESLSGDNLNQWINAKDKKGYTPLIYAGLSGNIEYIDFLAKNGANLEEDFIFRNNNTHRTALSICAMAGRRESVEKFIELGANIKNDIVNKNPLSSAVPHNDLDLIKKILEKAPELKSQSNIYQENIMHVLAKYGNQENCEYLLAQPFAEELLTEKDVYGRTPLDVANINKNIPFIKSYGKNHNMVRHPEADNFIDLGQGTLNEKLMHYLKLTNQNPDIIDPVGTCNGLAFLKSIYANRAYHAMLDAMKANSERGVLNYDEFFSKYYDNDNSIRNDYYKIKDLLGQWNGSYEELDKPIGIELHDYSSKTPLKQLLREWTEHVAWFHQDKLSSDFQEFNKTQKDRTNQIEFLGIKNFSTEPDVVGVGTKAVTQGQLEELLAILATKPGTKLELGGAQHVVSIYCPWPGKLDFYDPNVEGKFPIYSDPQKLATDIMNIKYKGLAKHEMSAGQLLMRIDWRELKSDGWPKDIQRKVSTKTPRSQNEIADFQNASPNHFNQMHRAILENDMDTAKKLLTTSALELNEKDAFFEKTPKELCLYLKRKELIKDILKRDKNGDELMNDYIDNQDYDMVDVLIACDVLPNTEKILSFNAPGMGTIHIDTLRKYDQYITPKQWLYSDGFESAPFENLMDNVNNSQVFSYVQELARKHPELNEKIHIKPEKVFECLSSQDWESVDKLLALSSGVANEKYNNTPLFAYLVHFANDNDLAAQDLMRTFLKSGADINAQAPSGKTALHLAAYASPPKRDIITLLCQNGALDSLEIKDGSGNTPMDVLKSKLGFEDIINTIEHLKNPPSRKAGLTSQFKEFRRTLKQERENPKNKGPNMVVDDKAEKPTGTFRNKKG